MSLLPEPSCFGLPDKFTSWRMYQDEAILGALDTDKRFYTCVAPVGSGKCLEIGTPVLMFDGATKAVEDVEVGDKLMGPDSRPRTILSTTQGHGDLFQVIPVKGEPYTVNSHHILALKMTNLGKGKQLSYFTIPIQDYLKRSNYFKYNAKGYRVGVEFASCPIPLDPYFLGLWLADGTLGQSAITTMDQPVIDYIIGIAKLWGMRVRIAQKKDNKACTVHLSKVYRSRWVPNKLRHMLTSLGLSEEKFVPESYKINSRYVRLQILAGYLDGDGHVERNGFDFISKYKQLADDIAFLVRSLGLACYVKRCVKGCQNGFKGTYYRGTISGNTDIIPTKLSHKQAKPRKQKKNVLHTGITVEPIGQGYYAGFTLDGDGLFLLGDFTVTHNSLSAVTTAILNGGRTVYLTSTKPLQTQLMNDFASIGMVDIRGRNAYKCRLEHDGTTCDHGPCMTGAKCDLQDGGCEYFDALAAAKSARLIVTNYACWMTQLEYGKGLGDVDLLICDEAHDTPNMLDSFLTIEFDHRTKEVREILPIGDSSHLTMDNWRGWALAHLDPLDEEVLWLKQGLHGGGNRSARRRLSILKALKSNLETISTISDEWVFETDERGVRFSPAWPAAYAEDKLFNNIKKVIMTSGSVRPKTLEILGIDSKDNEIVEYPHTFPLANRLLYHIPTVRLNQYSTEDHLKILTVRVDQIIRNRLDRKGMIHTISYARGGYMFDHSEFSRHMMTNKRGRAESALKKFLNSAPPTIMISPSMMTGIDLPHESCRYQIILKVPYPSTQGALMQARTERDPGYPSYIAAQSLVQAYGRTTRADDDFSESFIVDDNILWFLNRYSGYVPQYFHDAFTSVRTVPSPPSLLQLNNNNP